MTSRELAAARERAHARQAKKNAAHLGISDSYTRKLPRRQKHGGSSRET